MLAATNIGIVVAAAAPAGGGGGGTGGGGTPTVTYTPAAGTYSATDAGTGSVDYSLAASSTVVWNWSATNNIGLTSTLATGSSGTRITFTLTAGSKARVTTVTVTSGTNTWHITLSTDADGTASGGGTL